LTSLLNRKAYFWQIVFTTEAANPVCFQLENVLTRQAEFNKKSSPLWSAKKLDFILKLI
jgi:hypothetical protein